MNNLDCLKIPIVEIIHWERESRAEVVLVIQPGQLSTAWPSQGCSCQLLPVQGSWPVPRMLWGALHLHIGTKPNCRTKNSSAEGDGFIFTCFTQTFLDEDADGEAVQFGWEHRHPEESLMEQPCLHTRPGLCHHVTMSRQHGGVQQKSPVEGVV